MQTNTKTAHTRFPVGIFLLGVLGVLSGDWFSLHLFELLVGKKILNGDSSRVLLVCFPLTLFLGWLLWHLHHRFIRNRTIRQSALYYLCAFGLVISAGWLVEAFEQWVKHGPLHFADQRPWFFTSVAAFVVVACWVGHAFLREEPESVEDVSKPETQRQGKPAASPSEQKQIAVSKELTANCRALILFVSTPNIVPEVVGYVRETDPPASEPETPTPPPISPAAPDFPHVIIKRGAKDPKDCKECRLAGGLDNLNSDINALTSSDIHWNWQQLLRAMRDMPHLEWVYLLGSEDSPGYKPEKLIGDRRPEYQPGFTQRPGSGKGSFNYLDMCREFLKAYLRPRTLKCVPAVIPWREKSLNFENFNDLTKALRDITTSLLDSGLKTNQILVDVTGGQKVASIVGAVLTVNNELRFQYVQTNAPYDSVPYDLVRRSHPSMELHISK